MPYYPSHTGSWFDRECLNFLFQAFKILLNRALVSKELYVSACHVPNSVMYAHEVFYDLMGSLPLLLHLGPEW